MSKRLLIVGGLGSKNIPKWITNAFEVEHYEQQTHFKLNIAPDERPDLVVALKSWISHKQFSDAKEFADLNNIPFIVADNGFASVIQRTLEKGLTWFAQAINNKISSLSKEEAKETETILESAWQQAYTREYQKTQALEKRLRKEREKLDSALIRLSRFEEQENAAQRVIIQVREATKKRKEAEFKIRENIKELALALSQILIDHEINIKTLREKIDKLSSQ